jgi:hypothetical protein
MAKKLVFADVLVKGEWWNAAIKPLTSPQIKSATKELMRVRGPLVSEDFHGIWMADAPSNLINVKDPQRPVMMRVFIPWLQIVGIGVIEGPGITPGFTVEPVDKQP